MWARDQQGSRPCSAGLPAPLTDSTATVIGAMIIAPLSTPIMGVALGSVQPRRTGSARVVLFGAALVIAIGTAFSTVLPSGYDLLSNSRIASRTSPPSFPGWRSPSRWIRPWW